MKAFSFLVFSCALWAQTAPAPPPASLPNLGDDEVIATFSDGTKITTAQFKAYYAILSPQQQQLVLRDPGEFLHQWAVFRRLSQIALERKLNEQSPYKEALDQNRMTVLSQATANDTLNSFVIEPNEIVKNYEANKSKYTEIKVKAIYIAYTDSPKASPINGKKLLSEPAAKAKAAKLLEQIRGGADFLKLVKENSDDETSREKNGDFATLKATDNMPEGFRAAIFKLKQGETTEPLQQPNGYYLFRAEEVNVKPLAQVRDEIYNDLKNNKFTEWMAKLNRETTVEVSPKFAPKK